MLRALVAALVVVGLLVAGSGAATAAHTTSTDAGVSAQDCMDGNPDYSGNQVDGPIGGGTGGDGGSSC